MLKCPRFIIEYANYKISALDGYNTFTAAEKAEIIRAIDKAVYCFRAGLCTIDETVDMIRRQPCPRQWTKTE